MFQQLNHHLRKMPVGVKKYHSISIKLGRLVRKWCFEVGQNCETEHVFSESLILKGNPFSFAYMTELHGCQHFTKEVLNLLKQLFFLWKLSVRKLSTTSALEILLSLLSCHHTPVSNAPCEGESVGY